MFGCIAAGRLVQTNPTQVGEGKFAFSIEDAMNVNHVVIFLLGTTPLPQNFGAAVYFSWPPYGELLGYISNDKPSAVFKIGKGGSAKSTNPQYPLMSNIIPEIEMGTGDSQNVQLQLGLSIEPLSQIQQQLEGKESTSNTSLVLANYGKSFVLSSSDMITFARKALESLFNYALSFEKRVDVGFGSNVASIPTEALKKWYTSFEAKVQKDPFFWRE